MQYIITAKCLRTIVFTLLVLFFGLTSIAQVIPNASPQDWDTLPFKSYADYKLQSVNKSYITTGVLYDRMLPIAGIDDFKAGMSMAYTTSPTHLPHFNQKYIPWNVLVNKKSIYLYLTKP